MKRSSAGLLSSLAAVAGLAFCAWLLWTVDAPAVARQLGSLKWRALLLVPISLLWMAPNTLGWAFAFPPGGRPPFWGLFGARLSGEAVNAALPSGYLGGEPLKAAIAASWTDAGTAMSSVSIAKISQTFALLCFVLAGAGLAAARAPIPDALRPVIAGVCALLASGVLALTFGSASGLLGRLAAKQLAKGREGVLTRLAERAREWDAAHLRFFGRHKRRLAASAACHLVGWSAAAVELWTLAWAMGSALSPVDAFIMASLATAMAVGGFLIPGMLGAFEGGHAAAAVAVGLPAEVGLSIALARRARELFWIGAGAGLLAWLYRPIWTRMKARLSAKSAALICVLFGSVVAVHAQSDRQSSASHLEGSRSGAK